MACALDAEGARSAGSASREGKGNRPLLPRRCADPRRYMPGLPGLRGEILQRRYDRRADGYAYFRGMHENRGFRPLAAGEASRRTPKSDPLKHDTEEEPTMAFTRRRFMLATGAGAAALGMPTIARSQTGPIRVGLMTVKTGPLASGGIDKERALVQYLKERNYTMAGRRVELFVGDSGGVPAQARTKIQELVERDRIQVMIGPLATAEALAADEDMTQRKPNPWFTRGTSTSSQCSMPLADYCYKTLKMRRMAVIADDIAYGHEMCAGFMRVFEELGGKVVQRLFPPLTVPDYGTYLAQLKTNIDGVFLGFAGSNGFRYLRQFNEYGLRGKVVPVGGMTALDEAVLRNMGDEALGIVTSCWYSAEIE